MVDIDALLLRPALSTATFTGDRTVTLLFSVAGRQSYRVQGRTEVRTYDAKGRLAWVRVVGAGAEIRVPAQGVVLLIRR
jgi:hypothetical protein